jgi:two-component system alkaline phosphatase synthesis response regulator PhoP
MAEKILIVDDDNVILSALAKILEREGFTIQTLSNGDMLSRRLAPRPNLILLDKQLPGTDGDEICKSLKSNSDTNSIPVILMSSVMGLEAIALDAGADDFIEKPFVIHELVRKVKAHIEKCAATDSIFE